MAIRTMILTCVKKGYQSIVGNDVTSSLALAAVMNSDENGGRVVNMISEPVALAVAA